MEGKSEKNCTKCGRQFELLSADWAYKKYRGRGIMYFCSWKCIRAWEKTHEVSKVEKRERIIQALSDGLSVREVSALLDEDPGKVSYWKKRMIKENV